MKFELNNVKNDHKVTQKKLFTQTTHATELQRSMDTLMHAVSTLCIHDVVLLLNCPKVIRS